MLYSKCQDGEQSTQARPSYAPPVHPGMCNNLLLEAYSRYECYYDMGVNVVGFLCACEP